MVGTLIRFMILPIRPRISTPIIVWVTVPLPPDSSAPPITQAAIASSSSPTPVTGVPTAVRAVTMMPASALSPPQIV